MKAVNFAAVVMGAVLLTVPLASKAFAMPTTPDAPLPACVVEDGNGMPLCTWDGVISGDCAPDYVGGFEISKECVALHRINKEAVEECVEDWNLYDPSDPKYDGFTFDQCLRAFE